MLLAHEFACASCGAWTDFEFTTEAKLAVTGELIKLAADRDTGLAGKSKVLTRVVAQFARVYNVLLRRLGRIDRASLHASCLSVSKKVGRDDPCPCGSGKKYKKCCLGRS